MIERRPADSPPCDALAREIQGLMGADPSPEFLARVRSCLAGESGLSPARVTSPIWLFACAGHVIRFSRQLALTAVILAVLAAPSIYHAVRDRQRNIRTDVDDQLLLNSIGANVARAVPQVLEPLMQPLSPDKPYDTGRPR